MKKLFAVIAALFAIAACDLLPYEPVEPDYETVGLISEIEIQDVGMFHPSAIYDITNLSFVARFHVPGMTGTTSASEETKVMLTVPFDGAGTTLVLPQDPPEELLNDISSDFPAGFEISDTEAKTVNFTEIACNFSGKVTNFVHLYLDLYPLDWEVRYIYCDRPATITGEGENWWGYPTVYDLDLQKGWNMVVEKTIHEGVQHTTVTHLIPSGIRWKQGIWL